jgi:hypothetical protein
MSKFIQHIKLATENIVLCSDTCSKKDHYGYAEKMELMLKRQLKEEMEEMLSDMDNIKDNLNKFISKLN